MPADPGKPVDHRYFPSMGMKQGSFARSAADGNRSVPGAPQRRCKGTL